jgi:predicted permease
MVQAFWDDVAWAARRVWRSRGFSGLVVLILALTVGATVTIGSVLRAVAFRPLPYQDADRLVLVKLVSKRGSENIPLRTTAALAADLRSLDFLHPYSTGGVFQASFNDEPFQAPLDAVDPRHFDDLGIHPALGRLFGPSDATGGTAPAEVVIGYDCWRRVFHGDQRVIGEKIILSGVPVTIIGVTPPGYTGIGVDAAADVTVLVGLVPELVGTPANSPRPVRSNYALGRLKAGISLTAAQAEVASQWPGVRSATVPTGYTAGEQEAYRQFPATLDSVERGLSSLRTRYKQGLVIIFVLSCGLCLLANANVAGLFLVRAQTRAPEFAISLALGSTIGRLVRQVCCEVALLAALAAAAGLAFSWWGTQTIGRVVWVSVVPLSMSLGPDWKTVVEAVIGAVGLAVGVTAVAVGLVSSRIRAALVQQHHATTRTRRLGRLIVAGQVALSVVVLFSGLLFLESLSNLRHVDIGVRADRIVFARLLLRPGEHTINDPDARDRDVLAKLLAEPDVESAGLGHLFPAPLAIERLVRPADSTGTSGQLDAALEAISPGFFRTLSVSLLRGRDFAWSDRRDTAQVAIISSRLATALWGRAEPVGRRLEIGEGPDAFAAEVVGVVTDIHLGDVRKPALPAVFRPLSQEPSYHPIPLLFTRFRAGVTPSADLVRRVVASFGRETIDPIPLEREFEQSLLQERLLATFGFGFGIVAALLGFVGLFSVIAHTVTQQRREIGVRLAIGATPGAIRASILRESFVVTAVGLALGVPLSFATTRLFGFLLFRLSPADPWAVVATLVTLAVLALAAAWLPSAGAARTDVIAVLREI